MAIKHVVRCDGDECGREAALIGSTSTLTGDTYDVPSEWKQIDGRQFCSWKCLSEYAQTADKRVLR